MNRLIPTLIFLMPLFAVAVELHDPTRPGGWAEAVNEASETNQQDLILQAVFFNPGVKAVLINGITYRVGDQIADATVLHIETDRVVLKSQEGEREILLNMPVVKSRHEAQR